MLRYEASAGYETDPWTGSGDSSLKKIGKESGTGVSDVKLLLFSKFKKLNSYKYVFEF